jgi:nitrate/TMAO reductase-like tetraheme cytochrome c subunit
MITNRFVLSPSSWRFPMPKYTYTVNVTSADIAKGVRHNCDKCPVALALARRFNMNDCTAAASYLFATTIGVVRTPEKVYKFMKAFDRGQQVKPFRFTFEGKRIEKCVYK